LPIDLPWVARRVMEHIHPTLIIVMETELWPGLFAAARQRRVPVMIVNGRISPRSLANYVRVRWFMRRFLSSVALFVMQSSMDAERIEKIGVSRDRIRVSGNIKYDQALIRPRPEAMLEMQKILGQPGPDPILLAASTHPGEEEIVLDVFRRLKTRYASLRLILVPRHPERTEQVALMIQNYGCNLQTLSQSHGQWPDRVLLVDQVGWLTRLYGWARLVFVGGSLVSHGGQNMLEPAGWGVPVVFGPHTFNFKDISRQLLAAGGALVVANADDLHAAFGRLLDDEDLWLRMGQAGRAVVEENAGALGRTRHEISMILKELGHEPTAPVS
ncbi:MAG: 3-deoxy-D-manno-octulosonic acid transferase, partial [Magnetococcales bacterium]|nr:3-deoxy-D-manno-octulosonic acid transferase [Magnetococcales bacterium]